jgi:hypothetical protein
MAWRGFFYGLAGGFVLGFIGGFIAAMHDPSQAATYGTIGGYIAAIPASMLALKQALQKNMESLLAAAQQRAAGDAPNARA